MFYLVNMHYIYAIHYMYAPIWILNIILPSWSQTQSVKKKNISSSYRLVFLTCSAFRCQTFFSMLCIIGRIQDFFFMRAPPPPKNTNYDTYSIHTYKCIWCHKNAIVYLKEACVRKNTWILKELILGFGKIFAKC